MLLFLAVALLSAGALAYEVLLTRLFSIVQWHHYAYMVISIALLGYGASGALLAVVGDRLRCHLGAAFAAGAALFAVSAVTSFAVAERLPFNALAVIWEPRQLLFLPILYTMPLSIPGDNGEAPLARPGHALAKRMRLAEGHGAPAG